jgi:hypothetical protein
LIQLGCKVLETQIDSHRSADLRGIFLDEGTRGVELRGGHRFH